MHFFKNVREIFKILAKTTEYFALNFVNFCKRLILYLLGNRIDFIEQFLLGNILDENKR